MSIEPMWSNLLIGSMATLAATWFFAFATGSRVVRSLLAVLVPAVVIGSALIFASALNPYARLALSSLVLLYAIKGASLLRMERSEVRNMNRLGLAIYTFAWPGVDPQPFQARQARCSEDGRRFGTGMAWFLFGSLGFVTVAGFSPYLGPSLSGWLTILAILSVVHLGFADLLSEMLRVLGWRVPILFDRPWRSHTLLNFWSLRWNRPFVEMNRLYFLPWLRRRIGTRWAMFAVFLISGILHELAISFPAGAGWGLPLLYFLVQGVLVLIERRFRFRGSLWVAVGILGPLPLLFHTAFRTAVIQPLVLQVHGLITRIPMQTALSDLVIALGVAHFGVLFASFQVPTRLRWREELGQLSSFNRKLMWTYGAFTVFTIVAWGTLTLVCRSDMIQGSTSGIALSLIIFLFWSLRLATDALYFDSRDWPSGRFLQIGHVFLNCLFGSFVVGYGSILAYHLFRTGR